MTAQPQNLHSRPFRNAVWRAGAGAGKTYNLVQRIAALVETWPADQPQPRFVVSTFTRLATAELKDRIRHEAIRRMQSGDHRLVPFARSEGVIRVSTLHGLAELFLRQHGSAIQLDPSFQLATERQVHALKHKVIQALLVGPEVRSEALNSLLEHFGFSGAYSVLEQIAGGLLLSDHVRPARAEDFESLYLERTREMAQDFLMQLADFPEDWRDYQIEMSSILGDLCQVASTADCERIAARSEGLSLPVKKRNQVLSESQSQFKEKTHKTIRSFLNERMDLSEPKAKWLELGSLNTGLELDAKKLLQFKTEFMAQDGIVPLDQIEPLALALCRKHPEAAQKFGTQFDYWLIDEYQDTSPLQVELLECWTKPVKTFVVGDPQQSIYLFRGARPFVFFNRMDTAKQTDAEVVELQDNRRSHPDVLAAINSIATQLGPEFSTMNAVRPPDEFSLSGFRRTTLFRVEPPEQTLETAEAKRKHEALAVAQLIQRMVTKGANPAEIAVLGRTHSELRFIADALRSRAVPVQIHSSGLFAERVEVQDLCAILLFLANPYDDENLIRVARAPWFHLDLGTLELGRRRKTSLWEVVRDRPEAQSLKAAQESVREYGFHWGFLKALEATAFWQTCTQLDPTGRREANAWKLIVHLTEAERSKGFNLRQFVAEVCAPGDDGNEKDARSALGQHSVQLMTIHASKGLEFKHVVLPFLGRAAASESRQSRFVLHETRGLFSVGTPSTESVGESWKDQMAKWSAEESQRLTYVAMTRARESLTLVASEVAPDSPVENIQFSRDHIPQQVLKTDESITQTFATPSQQVRVNSRPRPTSNAEPAMTSRAESVTASLKQKSKKMVLPSELAARLIAADRGTQLHAVFDVAARSLKAQSRLAAKDDFASVLEFWKDSDKAIARKALEFIFSAPTDSEALNLSAVLTNGYSEWPFLMRTSDSSGSEVISGQIDLWGRDDENRLWIIDYKTGSSRYSEQAFQQLSAYAEALVQYGAVREGEPIHLAAVFPIEGQIQTRVVMRSGSGSGSHSDSEL